MIWHDRRDPSSGSIANSSIACSASLGGAVVLTICDTLARTAIPLNHLPTGAVTAVLGALFFLGILFGQKRRAALWGR